MLCNALRICGHVRPRPSCISKSTSRVAIRLAVIYGVETATRRPRLCTIVSLLSHIDKAITIPCSTSDSREALYHLSSSHTTYLIEPRANARGIKGSAISAPNMSMWPLDLNAKTSRLELSDETCRSNSRQSNFLQLSPWRSDSDRELRSTVTSVTSEIATSPLGTVRRVARIFAKSHFDFVQYHSVRNSLIIYHQHE